MEHCARKDASIRSPTGIRAGLGEHLALMERHDKIPIGDRGGFGACSSMEAHLKHLRLVLEVMRDHTLYAKLSKYVFGITQVEYLGHIISNAWVATNPNKIKVVLELPIPTSVKQLRGFLGLTGYYRKFVKGYAAIAQPLTGLLKKSAFKWTD
ncbi:hypothetical protein Tco_0060352 [Tanacetum coccineum]